MNNNKPIITIGITAFNEGELLSEAWNSVLNQITDNWETVMVLDGGGDKKTRKVFDSIQHLTLTKYSFSENQGTYTCRTKAIELTETEWYFHLDADDLLPQNAIELLINTINLNPNVEFIAGACKHFNLGAENIVLPSLDIDNLSISPLFFAQAPIKKSLFSKIGGYYIPDDFLHSDWDFWLSVYELGIEGYYIDDILYHRRRRMNSLTDQHIHELPQALEYILDRHPKYFNSDLRINKAKYNVYHNNARYYKSIGKRTLAKKYADICLKYGPISSSITAINEEMKMSRLRYLVRKIGKIL